jgi:hypothetical protein
MSAQNNWFINSDMTITVKGLRDENGAYLNSATVTGQMSGPAGNIGGVINFSYVASSNGDYVGSIAPLALTEGVSYTLTITATSGGETLTVQMRRLAAYRMA